ncbi:hypothetical protein JRQ81_000094 [Phrynocephalus forsythii]|uniref:Glycine N-acyltransferase-like protein n=1 Tax=Phrynocephalus forsythii TaxID=171643 RepID=A0A9Q1B7R9_9SAUR|nr:hypothetical protein JRQ81_000094 [Phrynocephalus forsythii]
MNLMQGISVLPLQTTCQVTTDTSPSDCGACWGHLKIHGLWTNHQQLMHIKQLEMLAIIKVFKVYWNLIERKTVQLVMDNTTVMYYVNKQGGTHLAPLLRITLTLWHWCIAHQNQAPLKLRQSGSAAGGLATDIKLAASTPCSLSQQRNTSGLLKLRTGYLELSWNSVALEEWTVPQEVLLNCIAFAGTSCLAAPVRAAMLILTGTSKLQLLEGVLRKSLPLTLPVYGTVMHINRGNPARSEVLVDSWPEFKAILTRPQQEVVKDKGDYYANLHAAFYHDVDACRALLENADAIDWGRALQIQGLQDGLYEITKEKAVASHAQLKPYCYVPLMHPDPSALPQSRLRNDHLRFGVLNPSHASFLNEAWDFGRNHRSLRYLESLIRLFPSACLVDKEERVVSWSLSDPFGCISHGYTLPQYRGQGCVGAALQRIGGKLHSRGFPLYVGVLAENQPSLQSLKKQGFHILPGTYYMLIVTPSLTLEN